MEDDRDFTDRYNTALSTQDERQFQAWMSTQSGTTGRDVSKDLYDYDLRGWWKENPGVDLNGAHLTDTFKKPNHPTFSTFSRYNGVDGMQGGQWSKQPGGSWSFTPGSSNVYSVDELRDYFRKVEPGNTLTIH